MVKKTRSLADKIQYPMNTTELKMQQAAAQKRKNKIANGNLKGRAISRVATITSKAKKDKC
jgi:hypothetical protein